MTARTSFSGAFGGKIGTHELGVLIAWIVRSSWLCGELQAESWLEAQQPSTGRVLPSGGRTEYETTYRNSTTGHEEVITASTERYRRFQGLQQSGELFAKIPYEHLVRARYGPKDEFSQHVDDTFAADSDTQSLEGERLHHEPPPTSAEPKTVRPAGISTAGDERQKNHASRGILVGEKFSADADPKRNTVSQKAWLYTTDPALKYRDNVPTLDCDNFQTSIQLPSYSAERRTATSHARVRTFTRTMDPTAASQFDGVKVFMDD